MYLPIFPRAIESLDLSGYDVIVSSSHAFAKGVRVRREQMHVCYCYTPIRYAWDLQEQYLEQAGLARGLRGVAARALLRRLRRWDRRASDRVTHFVAISRYIATRIRAAYGRDSTVIYPPVTIAQSPAVQQSGGDYVTVSALVPYKRVDLLIDAFRGLPDRRLVIIGDGPDRRRLQRAAGSNVTFTGRVSDAERDRRVAQARAFVFAAEEDFGIGPLEAQGLGVPVIAFAAGASAETIRDLGQEAPTGVLFPTQSAAVIVEAVRAFEANAHRIDPRHCRENAARFSSERFRHELQSFVSERWRAFQAAL
jgi:glycosyltransferase involved in cell wall biosynthesis